MQHQPVLEGPPGTAQLVCSCGLPWGHAGQPDRRVPVPPARPVLWRLLGVGLAAIVAGVFAAIIIWPAAWFPIVLLGAIATYALMLVSRDAA